MSKAPAFQFYPKQYVADNKVQAMEWDAKGMYVHLLCMAWQEIPPCSIPNDDAVLRRWLGLAQDTEDNLRVWRRVRPQIISAFSLRDNRWFQEGLLRTWEAQQRRSLANTKNVNNRYQASTNSLRNPYEPHEEEVLRAVDVDVGSKKQNLVIQELIYAEYPRKVAKGAAIKAIAHALVRLVGGEADIPLENRQDAADWLRNRVIAFSRSPAGQQEKFTPHPATWFNAKRYLDDESEWYVHGQPELSKVEQRSKRDREVLIQAAFGETYAEPRMRGRPSDAQFVGCSPEFPPCPFGECDGSTWYINRATRQRTECRCATSGKPPAADPILKH